MNASLLNGFRPELQSQYLAFCKAEKIAVFEGTFFEKFPEFDQQLGSIEERVRSVLLANVDPELAAISLEASVDVMVYRKIPMLKKNLSTLNDLFLGEKFGFFLIAVDPVLKAIDTSIRIKALLFPSHRNEEYCFFFRLSLMKAHALVMMDRAEEAKTWIEQVIPKLFSCKHNEVQSEWMGFYLGLIIVYLEDPDECPLAHFELISETRADAFFLISALEKQLGASYFEIGKFSEIVVRFDPEANSEEIEAAVGLLANQPLPETISGDLFESPDIDTWIAFAQGNFLQAKKLALENFDVWTLLCIHTVEKRRSVISL